MSKRALIIVPTYNERENIEELLHEINSLESSYAIDVLVVDSNSPDGTGDFLEEKKKEISNLLVYHQEKKMGLGKAYCEGFEYIVNNHADTYDAFVKMDADFSHHPRYIPIMLNELENFDMVVGSRYIPGGELKNWSKRRKWLSRYGNLYAKLITRIPVSDLTGGFHCFNLNFLKTIVGSKIRSEGYAFQIELNSLAYRNKLRVKEIPIIFADRTKGASKISRSVILEGILMPWKILFSSTGKK